MSGSPGAVAPRAAQVADAGEILRLAEVMYATVGLRADDAWRELGAQDLASRLGDTLLGWVIDSPEGAGALAACGFVALSRRLPLPSATSTLHGFVQWLVTDAPHRGRGYASAIMTAIEDAARERGVGVLDLYSSPDARGFYLARGYAVPFPVEFPASVRGVPMRKRLAEPWARAT